VGTENIISIIEDLGLNDEKREAKSRNQVHEESGSEIPRGKETGIQSNCFSEKLAVTDD